MPKQFSKIGVFANCTHSNYFEVALSKMLELANSCEIGQLHQSLVSKHFTIPYLTHSFAVKFCEMDEILLEYAGASL